MKAFRPADVDRLARRVLAGEVVFFVGAGFSLDSEGNTATRLIARLAARFEAFTGYLIDHPLRFRKRATGQEETLRNKARELRQGLVTTFNLKIEEAGKKGDPVFTTPENLDKLAREYYHINDWMGSAYAALLDLAAQLADHPGLSRTIAGLENRLLARYDGRITPNLRMDLPRLLKLADSRARGKALFLDTMGFTDPAVMAGAPLQPALMEVAKSYRGRLRPRYDVLARLAREGLSPVLLTTNYDLLLEGGYRMAGFAPREQDGGAPPGREIDFLPPTTFRSYSRIADATQFFGHGDDQHSAMIVKIHGCAETYRHRRDGGSQAWSSYLPAMVFTFREIQNWRTDSWSRDFLRTLLRTRTLVFCGYSGIDPVLHDTFRTVYEEMATRRQEIGGGKQHGPDEAPAFFLGIAEKKEFHGLEILRSASRAVGVANPDLTDHPNYLSFFLENDRQRRFPRVDELMRWVFHITLRRRQERALETDLGRIVTLMLGDPPPADDVKRVQANFHKLVEEEARQSGEWTDRADSRTEFERLIAWTERFQVGLLREFALAEAVLRNRRPGVDLHELQRWPWYYPILDHPDWAAWSAVVEIGLRRILAALRGSAQEWASDTDKVQPVHCRHPSIAFSSRERTPACLTIRLATFGHEPGADGLRGAYRRRLFWNLLPDEIPWSHKPRNLPLSARIPDARVIWDWAFRPDLARLDPRSELLQSWAAYLGGSEDGPA